MFRLLDDVCTYDENGNFAEQGKKLINTDNILYVSEQAVQCELEEGEEETLENLQDAIETHSCIHMTDGSMLFVEKELEDVAKILCGSKI